MDGELYNASRQGTEETSLGTNRCGSSLWIPKECLLKTHLYYFLPPPKITPNLRPKYPLLSFTKLYSTPKRKWPYSKPARAIAPKFEVVGILSDEE
jgi:hypothetical protein